MLNSTFNPIFLHLMFFLDQICCQKLFGTISSYFILAILFACIKALTNIAFKVMDIVCKTIGSY